MTKFTNNPLKNCKLRVHGLTSVKGATFGMVRRNPDGTPRAHQGIDLATPEGYRVYAVENGEITGISKAIDGYGFVVFLKINNPEKKELHGKIAFYSHLDRIDVVVGKNVLAGEQLGLSGDTGNAKGMTTIEKGGHLHFELRSKQVLGKGLKGRIDPLPFIELDK